MKTRRQPRDLITVQEAAARLDMTTKGVYFALREGLLTRYEQYGRIVLDAAEVAAYVPRGGAGRPSKRQAQGSGSNG